MKYLLELEPLPCLQNVIIQDLKDLGVRVDMTKKDADQPTIKKSKSKEDSLNICGGSLVFGNSLANVPSVAVRGCGQVPRFLVDAVQLLEKNISVEGLFRKSGSVQRLKDLRVRVDNGDSLSDAHPLDIASLLKQFLRELPEPLLTASLHDVFVSCVRDNVAMSDAVVLACLLLPPFNLSTLRFVALFLSRVAAASDVNRMDAANLAVCLAPNLLYADNSRSSVADNSVLNAETAVIRVVVEHAANIGMVSNSLVQRAVLLGACFPSDVEEQNLSSCVGSGTTTKVMKRKKKKRSGSLQGLVTTLSASFSRWRNHKEKNGHNTSTVSDRSTMSYVSFDKSSVMVDGDDLGISEYDIQESIVYPTVAATPKLMRKRKAEDETLPFSTSKKKAILSGMPQRSLIGGTPFTPHIRKGAGLNARHKPDIGFAPDTEDMVFCATTPKLPTSKLQSNQQISVSSTRLRRKHSLGKSGCFSPKTPKGGLRHSFRGFLRRLSGSKDRGHLSAGINTSQASDMIDRISTTSSDQVPMTDSRAGSRRKMVSSFFGRRQKTPSLSSCPIAGLAPSEFGSDTLEGDHDHLKNVDLSSCPIDGGDDNVLTGNEFARNGSAWHNMSLPPVRTRQRVYSDDGTPVGSTALRRGRPNSVKSGLQSPLSKQSVHSGIVSTTLPVGRRDAIAVIDTSPILARPEGRLSFDNDKENVGVIEATEAMNDEFVISALPRYPSKASIDIGTEMTPDDSTHNQAFTESMLVGSELAAPLADYFGVETEVRHDPDAVDSSVVKPTSEPCDKVESAQTGNSHVLKKQVHAGSVEKSQKPDAEILVPSKEPVQGSTTSLDSAVDVDSPECGVSNEIQRTHSQRSVTSHDSGLCMAAADPIPAPICLSVDGSIVSPPEYNSFQFSREGSRSIRIRSSIRRPASKLCGPNLQVTTDLHNLLSKAGVPVEEVVPSPIKEEACKNMIKCQNAAEAPTKNQPNSSTVSDLRELFERRSSPLRFANSTTRTQRVNSPTVQTTAKSDFGVAGKPPPSSKRAPVLPISTNLLRVSFESDCVTVKTGRSLGVALAGSSESNAIRTPGTATGAPRIKSALLTPSMAQRLGNRTNTHSVRVRSPGKPVKRLHVSPAHSQRSPKKQSPKRMTASSHAPTTISVPFNLDI